MSIEHDTFHEDDDELEDVAGRSIFSAGWFRALLLLTVMAIGVVVALPYLLNWFEPAPPPAHAPRPAPPPFSPAVPCPPGCGAAPEGGCPSPPPPAPRPICRESPPPCAATRKGAADVDLQCAARHSRSGKEPAAGRSSKEFAAGPGREGGRHVRSFGSWGGHVAQGPRGQGQNGNSRGRRARGSSGRGQ